jgi:hypothetical protein
MLLLEQQVGLGDDPEHAPVGVHHWDRTDPVLGEPGRDLLERRRRLGRHHLGRHHVAYQAAGHGSSSLDSAPARRTWIGFARQSAWGT